MLRSRKQKQRQCYFCLTPDEATNGRASPASPASRPRDWRCTACGCWNLHDRYGVITGDTPAMRDPTLNSASFAKRGRPSDKSLPVPSSTRASPFCRDCITNQTLVMNLLSNYLPDETDPSYPALSADLPRYIASLHERYPPVCVACQPSVDDALKHADQRAQAEAWGRALRRGAMRKDKPVTQLGAVEVGVWRVRGALWALDAASTWGLGLIAWLRPDTLARLAGTRVLGLGLRVTTLVFILRGISILWAVWDPTWLRRMRNHAELDGRRAWVTTMLALCCLRAGMATYLSMWYRAGAAPSPTVFIVCAGCDFIVGARVTIDTDHHQACIVALHKLRISQPVALTLVRPLHSSPPTPAPAHPAAPSLSALSLDSAPTPPPPSTPHPVFGLPSLKQAPMGVDLSEPMDWEPTTASPSSGDVGEGGDGGDWDAFGVGRQRMFPTQSGNDETGLESLLAGWGISTGAATAPPATPKAGGPPGVPLASLPVAGLAPRGIVLDDARLRLTRKMLLVARLVTFAAAVASVAIGIRIDDFAGPTLTVLLALEAAASGIALAVVLASRRPGSVPLAAIILASDAALRTAALVSPAVPSSLPYEALMAAGAEWACAAWAALDAFVLAST